MTNDKYDNDNDNQLIDDLTLDKDNKLEENASETSTTPKLNGGRSDAINFAKRSAFKDPFIDHVLFDHSNNINIDPTYWFKLRGNNRNLFIDCATPLLGMVLRVRTQKDAHKTIPKLYKQCVDEIRAIEVELIEADYEYATIVAYRYILCTYIDEAIMSTSWGAQSEWTSKSLLVHFHNESWGGEKIFLIIERLEKEIERYYDLLEFALLCLCLGFEGRFKVAVGEREKFESLVRELYEKLRRHSQWEPTPLLNPYQNICNAPYSIKQEWTVKKVVSITICLVLLIYVVYFFRLSAESTALVDELRKIL